MKDREMDLAFASNAMQLAVGLVDLPQAGEHSSILIAIGISQHDFLIALPGIEQARISP